MEHIYIGNCIHNPFKDIDEICNIIDNSTEISKDEFIKYCYIDDELYNEIIEYSDNFEFFRYRDIKDRLNDIYFFTHSSIEYFYK